MPTLIQLMNFHPIYAPHSRVSTQQIRVNQGEQQMHARIIGLVLSGLLTAPASHAGFELTGDARAWCKDKTLDYLRGRGYTPYNWTASTYVKNNDYVTEGVWRVDVDDIKVECVSKKDHKRASGKFKILNIEIIDGGNASK